MRSLSMPAPRCLAPRAETPQVPGTSKATGTEGQLPRHPEHQTREIVQDSALRKAVSSTLPFCTVTGYHPKLLQELLHNHLRI